MAKILRVMRNELIITFQRKSYLFFAFGLPVLAVLIAGGIQFFQSRSPDDGGDSDTGPDAELEVEGFVDSQGLILVVPEFLESILLPYETEALAQQALQDGEIEAYYIIPADYVERGEVVYVFSNDRSFLEGGQEWVMQRTLMLNLLEGDQALTDLVWNPAWKLETQRIEPQTQQAVAADEDCSRPGAACESYELVRMMPALMVIIFYIAFMSTSSMLFSSIATEKENRTLELLLLSVSPRQLLAGKTAALGLAGLTQTAVWLGTMYTMTTLTSSTLNLPPGFTFPVDILVWSIIFFLGGFALYASLMAGAGAMVPKMKEAGIANFIAMAPLLVAYIIGLIAPLAEATGSVLMVVLSLFPFTAPVIMIMRLTDGTVPLWELLLSAVLLFGTAYAVLNAVAAMFHAQNLLSGQPFSARRYFRAMIGRA